MTDAFSALQRLRANKTAAVAGVLAPLPLLAGDALGRRASATQNVVTEARRIRALPTWSHADLMEQAKPGGPLDYTERLRAPGGTMQLKPIQNVALHWIEKTRGLVGPLAVGAGKTLISLLAPVVMNAQRPILFIPPTLQIPLRREIEKLEKHFRMPKGLYIIPYSQLSVAKSTALLEQIKPDLIISDECFPYETRVVTDVGNIPIGDIVEKGRGGRVLSYDTRGQYFVWQNIVRRLRKDRKTDMVRVEHENGVFTCTKEHKIWTTNRGYVKAGDLKDSDHLLSLRQGEGGVPKSKRRHTDLVFPQLQASRARDLCGLRGDHKQVLISENRHLREESLSSGARGSEYGGCASPVEDEGSQDLPCVRERVCAFGVWGNSEEASHMLCDLYGSPAFAASGGGEQTPEGVYSGNGCCDLLGVRRDVHGGEEGGDHGEVLLSLLRGEEERPASLREARKGESQGNEVVAGARSGPRDWSNQEAGGVDASTRLSCVQHRVLLPSGGEKDDVLRALSEHSRRAKDERDNTGEESGVFGAYAEEQPVFSPGGEGEDVCLHAGPHVPVPRGEREADSSASMPLRSLEQCADGVPHSYGRGGRDVTHPPSLLQGGCGASRVPAGYRSGWSESQQPQVEIPRPPEGVGARGSRVVGVSLLEQGSGLLGGGGGESSTSSVYDLEVSDTHSYIAEGVVVSNCHNLRSPDTARTKRILRYFRQFPTTRFIALSGTLTSKSLRDYAHLCELALRGGSPLPTEEADLIAWANCLDAGSQTQDRDWSVFAAFADLRHIDDTAQRQDEARDVFRQRFVTTPGVVATTEASVQCSLNLVERPLVTPDVVKDALRELHRTWCRPDGEEMDSALSLWRLGMQISQGFYLRWVWPNGVVDHEWLEARSNWHKEVRYVLQRNITGLDSPFLVWQGVSRGTLTDPSIIRAWAAWDAVRGRPVPPTETVWIDDFLIRDAVRWLREHPKGLIWHNDLATESALRAAGIPTYGRGEVPPLDGSKGGMALSIRVHGTGLNLQHHHAENLLLSFPSSAKTCEQLIGRTHRQGQEADEVNVYFYQHTTDVVAAVISARQNARYIEDTQGSPMKLCYGQWA